MQLPSIAAGIPAALSRAVAEGVLPAVDAQPTGCLDDEALLRKPVGLFYDLTAWEDNLSSCREAFGDGFLHALALKSNGIVKMLDRARDMGFGAECASIGEVRHAERLGFTSDKIIFDSPAKTSAEIRYALQRGIHLNIDNFQELDVVAQSMAVSKGSTSVVGLRVNPLCGAGEIAALSVSVSDSKFGISIARKKELLQAFQQHPWLSCVHVHVGSGGMGDKTLVAGIKTVVEFALEVNALMGKRQVTVLDIGGGLPVNYLSNDWHSDRVPSFETYAAALRREVPALFPGNPECPFSKVITEFGQSLNAKSGWLASRIEYTKELPNDEGHIVTIHFGADTCPRQCYTKDHTRRLELYDGTTLVLKKASQECPVENVHVAGPLCFQGDFLTKSLRAPRPRRGDIVVLREAGANTLSLFSRHCLRQVPAVYGYRRHASSEEVVEFEVLKPSEDLDDCSRHWGWIPDARL